MPVRRPGSTSSVTRRVPRSPLSATRRPRHTSARRSPSDLDTRRTGADPSGRSGPRVTAVHRAAETESRPAARPDRPGGGRRVEGRRGGAGGPPAPPPAVPNTRQQDAQVERHPLDESVENRAFAVNHWSAGPGALSRSAPHGGSAGAGSAPGGRRVN